MTVYALLTVATLALVAFLVLKRNTTSDTVHNVRTLLISAVITSWMVLLILGAVNLAGLMKGY